MNKQLRLEKIIALVRQAQHEAAELGYTNLFQPGLVKELIVGSILNHEVHQTKHAADAWNPDNPDEQYEYLSCWEGGTFQLDRMFRSPKDKREKSLLRITRNSCFFCAVFEKDSPLTVKCIYKVPTERVLAETLRQLDASQNAISHVGFSEKWVVENGRAVYTHDHL